MKKILKYIGEFLQINKDRFVPKPEIKKIYTKNSSGDKSANISVMSDEGVKKLNKAHKEMQISQKREEKIESIIKPNDKPIMDKLTKFSLFFINGAAILFILTLPHSSKIWYNYGFLYSPFMILVSIVMSGILSMLVTNYEEKIINDKKSKN